MKNVLYIVLSLVLLTGCSGLKEVKVEKLVTEETTVKEEKVVTYLQNRNGIKYELDTEVGFTGVYVEEYINGQKKVEKHYKDGKLEGLWTWWHENGKKFHEGKYKGGKRDGHATKWYKNGQKKQEGKYKDGEEDGLWTDWDKDGNITRTDTYKDGEKVQ